jgi:two-component system sensor histidine kinase PilS (NtrC family)
MFYCSVCCITPLAVLPSGIGNLIVVAVAVANILLYRNIGLLIAAAGAAGIIYLTFYLSLSHPEASGQFMQAGMLGALCFAAALGVQALGRKLLASQQLLEQQTTAVASLEALNAAIIARMRTGILVLDREFNILQYNQSALHMLESRNLKQKNLQEYFPSLIESYQSWQKKPFHHASPAAVFHTEPAAAARFCTASTK